MIEVYDFVHQWTTGGGQLTSSDVRLMIDGMASLRYTSLFYLDPLHVPVYMTDARDAPEMKLVPG